MNFDELRRLSQEGQKNVEAELIQLCEKCNPKQIADIIMVDIEKTAKEGKYNAATIFYFTSYQKNQHPNIQAMNKDIFCDLNIYLDYDKKAKLIKMLFEKVKSYITNRNIEISLEFADDKFSKDEFIKAIISWR